LFGSRISNSEKINECIEPTDEDVKKPMKEKKTDAVEVTT
jgi:hypothetical protein